MSDKQILRTDELGTEKVGSQESVPESISTEIREKDTVAEKTKQIAEQFLLAEFNELGQFWRHTNSRFETTVNFYLTIGAIVIPSIAVLHQTIADVRLFVLSVLPICVVMTIFGFFLMVRTVSVDVRKAEYATSVSLIRRYFVDHNPKIEKYLYFPLADPINNRDTKMEQVRPYFHKGTVYAINAANSIFIGIFFSGVLWLVISRYFLPNTVIVLVGVGAAMINFVTIVWLYRKFTNRFNPLNEDW